jgi:hypothetical protein
VLSPRVVRESTQELHQMMKNFHVLLLIAAQYHDGNIQGYAYITPSLTQGMILNGGDQLILHICI